MEVAVDAGEVSVAEVIKDYQSTFCGKLFNV